MKQQRFRYKLIALFLFALLLSLAVYGSYSVLTYGNRWFSSRWNPRVRAQKENVTAGSILDRSGLTLAQTTDGKRVYQQDEAIRKAVVHIIGDEAGHVANGVETFQSSYLYGFETSLSELISAVFSGSGRRGDDVTLTIDGKLCAEMADAFTSLTGGKRGAAVVMNYRTGELLGYVSLPSFDPNAITAATLSDAAHPFWNRATQAVYPPGSTFKIITAEAALAALPQAEDSTFDCTGVYTVDGQRITDAGNSVHGRLTLVQAFSLSCNNAFAMLADYLGADNMQAAAERFGFNDNFLFRDLVVANSAYPTEAASRFVTAISGFGQGQVSATPLHMCMVAAAVANDGVMMEPRLLLKVTGPSSRQRASYTSAVYKEVMSRDEAAVLQRYMRSVVTGGTGTAAAVSGLTVCGKTGTAESTEDGERINYGWFVGYAADSDCPFAISVLVEGIADTEGGGSTAAPVAAAILRYLRDHADELQAAEIQPAVAATSLVDGVKDVYQRLTTTPEPTAVPSPTVQPTITPVPERNVLDAVKDVIEVIQKITD